MKHLLSPLQIGSKTVRNRIVSTAHGEHMASNGLLTDHMVAYHARRAQGGAGMLITFGSGTVSKSAASRDNVALWRPENEPNLRLLADLVHGHGTLILAQATHRATREALFEMDDVLEAPSMPPGAFKTGYYGAPHELTDSEINGIIDSYVDAACRLARCGWDGIQITALGSHLIEHFWSPVLNRRTDKWGGDEEGRMRFSLEVIRAVARATPDDFLISFRLSADLATEEIGLDFEALRKIALRLDAEQVISFFDISGGSGFNTETHAAAVPPEGFGIALYNELAGKLRGDLSVPVLAAGRMFDPEVAEAALEAGHCDLVAMTRALIADPDLPKAVAEGRPQAFRPCIAINEGCRRVTIGRSVACSVNPGVADPNLMDFSPAENPRTIRVIGGGPAGMEAARVAATRGHAVTLYERESILGGQMHDFAAISGWPHLMNHVLWLEREIERLGIRVVTGTAITDNEVAGWNDDVIILATGAETVLPPEAEVLGDRAVTDTELLRKPDFLSSGMKVAIIDMDGRLRAAKTAVTVARFGADVAFHLIMRIRHQ